MPSGKSFKWSWIENRKEFDHDAKKLIFYFNRNKITPHRWSGRRQLLELLDVHSFDFNEMKQTLYDLELKYYNEKSQGLYNVSKLQYNRTKNKRHTKSPTNQQNLTN